MIRALLHISAATSAVLLFFAVPESLGKTTIDISNNGEGSRNSVEVEQSTGGIHYKSSSTSDVSTKIRVNSNGTVVETTDETGTNTVTEGPSESGTSVKVYQTGDAEPTIIIEKGSASVKSDSDSDSEKIKKEAEEKAEAMKKEAEKAKDVVIEEIEEVKESLLSKLFNIKIVNEKVAEDLQQNNVFLAAIHIFTHTELH